MRFTAAQYDYLMAGDHLPAELRGRVAALGGPANQRERVLELGDDLLTAVRDALSDRLLAVGYDADYELTAEGRMLDGIVGMLIPDAPVDPQVVIEALKQVAPEPTLLVAETTARTVGNAVLGWRAAGLTALVVRGRKMRTTTALFDEAAAALQFPYYFGENWNALDECLSEIDWLPLGDGLVLVVEDADQVMADRDEDLDRLVISLAHAFEAYGTPIAQGAWFDRPPVPFHVVLQVAPSLAPDAHARWAAAGAKLEIVALGAQP